MASRRWRIHAMRSSAKSRPRIQRRWPVAVLASCASIVVAAHVFDLRINLTDSAPRGLYRATRPPRIVRDALVIACLPEPIASLGRARGYLRAGDWPADSQELLKRIVAVSGDSVRVSASGVVVNGRAISGTELRAVDRAGQPLAPAFLGDHAARCGGALAPRLGPGRELGQPLLRRHSRSRACAHPRCRSGRSTGGTAPGRSPWRPRLRCRESAMSRSRERDYDVTLRPARPRSQARGASALRLRRASARAGIGHRSSRRPTGVRPFGRREGRSSASSAALAWRLEGLEQSRRPGASLGSRPVGLDEEKRGAPRIPSPSSCRVATLSTPR